VSASACSANRFATTGNTSTITSSPTHWAGILIEDYHRELVPLIVPVTMLKHYVDKHGIEYLKDQYYLNPHPIELKLRNHV